MTAPLFAWPPAVLDISIRAVCPTINPVNALMEDEMQEKKVRALITERLEPMRRANFDRDKRTAALISGTVFLMSRLIGALIAGGATTPEAMAATFADHYARLSETEHGQPQHWPLELLVRLLANPEAARHAAIEFPHYDDDA